MNRATSARLGAAAVSGALLAAARPPLDAGAVACIAFVPLFVAWRGRPPRAMAGYAFVAGIVYFALLLSWTWYFGAVAIVPLVAVLAAYWAASGALIGWLARRGVANPFLVAAVWVLAEAAVARFPLGGFSWGEVGYAFHNIEIGRALASDGGVELVSFFAVALNAFLADALIAAFDRTAPAVDRRTLARAGAGLAVVGLLPVGALIARTAPHPDGTMRIAIVQGNDLDRDPTPADGPRYLPASHFALAARIHAPVDLVVFPESSMNTDAGADPRTDPYLHENLVAVAKRTGAWVLANASVDAPAQGSEPAGARALNLDVLLRPDGSLEGTYAKRHLVPFGEYVPFRSLLEGHIKALEQVPRDFEPGHAPGLFEVAHHEIATIICFESAFGYQVRPLVHAGAQVIVLSTNNRSYERSANSAQHVAIGQMRAAETGRPLVQAAISGISAVIDANGVVHQRTQLFRNTVVQATITPTTGETPYVRYGEWAIWACGAGLLAALGLAVAPATLRRGRRSRFVESETAIPDESEPAGSRIVGDQTEAPSGAAPVGNLTNSSASSEPRPGEIA